jgi:hypothetical protein
MFTELTGNVQVLDNDGSGLLTFDELCTEMKKLVRPWKIKTPIEFTWVVS